MSHDRPVYTAQDPSDLVNVLPAAFGFVPQESICALATSGPRHRMGFRMRMDLDERVAPDDVARAVRHHLERHGADGAMIVAVSERPDVAERYVRAVEQGLGRVTPVIGVWATDQRWWTTSERGDPAGHAYERTLHHVSVVQAVAEGQEVLGSREELRERITPTSGPAREWTEAAADEQAAQVAALIQGSPETDVVTLARRDVDELLRRVEAGGRATDGEILRLATWAVSLSVRDDLMTRLDHHTAPPLRALWERAARIVPRELRPAVVCLAGFAAHRCGQGAAAVIAAEAVVREHPEYSLGRLLLQIVEAGISPDEVSAVWRGERRRAG